MPEVEDILEHYGVKGMHWGVRKKASSGGEGEAAPKKVPRSEDSAKVKALKSQAKAHGQKTLTNKELKEVNERVQLESTFKKGINPRKDRLIKAGETAVIAALVAAGSKLLSAQAKNIKQIAEVIDWEHILSKA